MSLITDTLNKMKKEQDREENDDKMMAPPALRNAIVNTKKYQEFVKNAEIKDVYGHKAPLKGFVVVSIILLTVIGISTIYFLNKEEDTLIKQAVIVSNNQHSEQSVNIGNKTKSLGKPYDPNTKANQQMVTENTAAKPTLTQTYGTENPIDVLPLNSMNKKQIQAQMASMPDSRRDIVNKKATSETEIKQKPVEIIPANHLFIITPQSVINNYNSAQTNKDAPVNNVQTSKPATEKKDVMSKNQSLGNNDRTGDIIKDELKEAHIIQVNKAEQSKNSLLDKDTVKNNTDKTEMAEVKAIKTNDPLGTVSASTISLYNQYVTTGNKAKNEGNYERAIEYYTNALALNKNDALSANIANMYLKLKNPNMAFQVVVKNGMTNAKLISILAVNMINSKYYLESNKLLQYGNTLDKSSYILFANGYYAQSQKQYDTAVKFYKDAITVNPSDVSSAYYSAICLEEQGKNNDAVTMYKYVINNSSSPENMKKQAVARVKKLGN